MNQPSINYAPTAPRHLLDYPNQPQFHNPINEQGAWIGGLRIVREAPESPSKPGDGPPRRVVEVTPDQAEYDVVASVIHLALSILESLDGRWRLAQMACEAITQCKADNRPHNLTAWNLITDADAVHGEVHSWLIQLRESFPDIILTQLLAWPAFTAPVRFGAGRRRTYNPRRACVIGLSKLIVEDLVLLSRASQPNGPPIVPGYSPLAAERNWESLTFHMGTVIAHELGHLWMAYLVMPFGPTGHRPQTPLQMTPPFLQGTYPIEGESGYWLDMLLYGGTIGPYEVENHPLGTHQGGEMWHLDKDMLIGFRRLDDDWIRRMLNLDFEELLTFSRIELEPAGSVYNDLLGRDEMSRARLNRLPGSGAPNFPNYAELTVQQSSDLLDVVHGSGFPIRDIRVVLPLNPYTFVPVGGQPPMTLVQQQ